MSPDIEKLYKWIQECTLPADLSDLFGDIIDLQQLRFRSQENYILDYKIDFPTEFKSDFGAGIVRLVLGFHNSFGGVIVCGVQDKSLEIVGMNQISDIEALNRILSDFSDTKIEVIMRRYDIKVGDKIRNIDVFLIPQRGLRRPSRLTGSLGKYKAGRLFIRDRHEVLDANSEHMPMLYCSNRDLPPDQATADVARIHRSFPPSPATMKEFIGRTDLVHNLWVWVIFGKKPRLYLYGPGGSGKSTLAFEFAYTVAEFGHAVQLDAGSKLDYVIYISGKETELNVDSRVQQYFSSRQFINSREQFIEILYHSGFASRIETSSLDEEHLLDKLEDLFISFNGLIVIDDIDALSRRSVDTGEEMLLMKLIMASKKTKLLYTLRHPPSHALGSAVRVTGLERDVEFTEFVSACCRLFDVLGPNPVEIANIFAETSGLPLLVETLIGLRKYCSNYAAAIESYRDKGGDEARRYLYQREYDRLNKTGKSRQILAALSIVREPMHSDEIQSIISTSPEQLIDAISECASIFLSSTNDQEKGTLYQITPPAIAFVSNISSRLDFYEAIVKKNTTT